MQSNSKPLNLSVGEVVNSFKGSFGPNLKIMRSIFHLRSLEVVPPEGSAFHLKSGSRVLPLSLPPDEVIGQQAFLYQNWDLNKVRFFASRAESVADGICLVDIGANVGLFSRQCASVIKGIQAAFAYEPHPENFELLKRNLSGWEVAPTLVNAALSSSAGVMTFYEEFANCGNYSLNPAAMTEPGNTAQVVVLNAASEERKWLDTNKKIFYKSDTQGYDEQIATNLSLEFWGQVQCAAFELWRIDKPEFDHAKFRAILDSFPHKIFEREPNVQVSAQYVLDYLSGRDRIFDDLLCWR